MLTFSARAVVPKPEGRVTDGLSGVEINDEFLIVHVVDQDLGDICRRCIPASLIRGGVNGSERPQRGVIIRYSRTLPGDITSLVTSSEGPDLGVEMPTAMPCAHIQCSLTAP